MGLISPPSFYIVPLAVAQATNRPHYLGNATAIPIKPSATRA